MLLQVAHLAEHRRAVNQVAVSSSGAFFVSASNDETVKVGASIYKVIGNAGAPR